MKNKKIILIISSVILYCVLMIQLICIYYVDYIYMPKINNEFNIDTEKKENLEVKNEYALEYNEDELNGFKLLTNNYDKNNYVKHYNFSGEKYDVLNKLNKLEKRNIKIKSLKMVCIDDNNISGDIIIEYRIKGKLN